MEQNKELKHYGVIGMKWGLRRASKMQYKATKLKSKAKKETDKTKASKLNKKANEYISKAKRQKQIHEDRTSKKTVDRISKQTYGQLAVQSMVFGTYGALKYNQAKTFKSVSRGKAIVTGLLSNTADTLTGGTLSFIEPRLNQHDKVASRKKSKRR